MNGIIFLFDIFYYVCDISYIYDIMIKILPGGGGLMPGGGGRAMFMTAGDVLGSRLK